MRTSQAGSAWRTTIATFDPLFSRILKSLQFFVRYREERFTQSAHSLVGAAPKGVKVWTLHSKSRGHGGSIMVLREVIALVGLMTHDGPRSPGYTGGPTLFTPAMRCFCLSQLGVVVEVQEELA